MNEFECRGWFDDSSSIERNRLHKAFREKRNNYVLVQPEAFGKSYLCQQPARPKIARPVVKRRGCARNSPVIKEASLRVAQQRVLGLISTPTPLRLVTNASP